MAGLRQCGEIGPLAAHDGCNRVGCGGEPVPSLAAGFDHGVGVGEHPVDEAICPSDIGTPSPSGRVRGYRAAGPGARGWPAARSRGFCATPPGRARRRRRFPARRPRRWPPDVRSSPPCLPAPTPGPPPCRAPRTQPRTGSGSHSDGRGRRAGAPRAAPTGATSCPFDRPGPRPEPRLHRVRRPARPERRTRPRRHERPEPGPERRPRPRVARGRSGRPETKRTPFLRSSRRTPSSADTAPKASSIFRRMSQPRHRTTPSRPASGPDSTQPRTTANCPSSRKHAVSPSGQSRKPSEPSAIAMQPIANRLTIPLGCPARRRPPDALQNRNRHRKTRVLCRVLPGTRQCAQSLRCVRRPRRLNRSRRRNLPDPSKTTISRSIKLHRIQYPRMSQFKVGLCQGNRIWDFSLGWRSIRLGGILPSRPLSPIRGAEYEVTPPSTTRKNLKCDYPGAMLWPRMEPLPGLSEEHDFLRSRRHRAQHP